MSETAERSAASESRAGELTFEELAKRVDDAVAALDDLDPAARAKAEDLQAAVEAVHRAGLVRIVRAMRADEAARAVLFDLVDDPLVHMLLCLRDSPAGSGNACESGPGAGAPATAQPRRRRVAGAHRGRHRLRPASKVPATVARCPRDPAQTWWKTLWCREFPSRGSRWWPPSRARRSRWRLCGSAAIRRPRAGPGSVRLLTCRSTRSPSPRCPTGTACEVIVVNLGQRLSAYRNECAHEAPAPLTDAVLEPNGTLTCPWHGFCFDAGSGSALAHRARNSSSYRCGSTTATSGFASSGDPVLRRNPLAGAVVRRVCADRVAGERHRPLLIPLTTDKRGPAVTGLVVASFFVGQLGAPVVGAIADRSGRQRQVSLGSFPVMALAAVGFGLLTDLHSGCSPPSSPGRRRAAQTTGSVFIVEGHPEAGMGPCVGRQVDFRRRRVTMGLFNSAVAMGAIVGAVCCHSSPAPSATVRSTRWRPG